MDRNEKKFNEMGALLLKTANQGKAVGDYAKLNIQQASASSEVGGDLC